MDRFDAMRVFTRVVERRSFTLAAEDLGLPRSTVTDAVKQLEAHLGVRLLERTTRQVRATLDGEAYLTAAACSLLPISRMPRAPSAAQGRRACFGSKCRARWPADFLLPNLPGFFAEYPDIEINMSESDRWIDLIHEGVDCVLRFGHLPDSDMIARQVVVLERLICAAPAYFARHGTPADLDALDGHRMVGLRSLTTARLLPMEFMTGDTLQEIALPVIMSVTGPESYLEPPGSALAWCRCQNFTSRPIWPTAPWCRCWSNCPPPSVPVSLLYPRNRQLSPRVRVFIYYVTRVFGRT